MIVAGATGAIGVPLVRALIDHGHEVIGLTRSARSAAENSDLWAGAIVADALDPESLRSAARPIRADAVIHQMTALARPPILYRDLNQTNDLRIRGTRHLLELAMAVGATRFVTQSFLGGYGYGDHGEAILTEDNQFAPPGRSAGLERAMAAMRAVNSRCSPRRMSRAWRYGLACSTDRAGRSTPCSSCFGAGSSQSFVTVAAGCPTSTCQTPQARPLPRWNAADRDRPGKPDTAQARSLGNLHLRGGQNLRHATTVAGAGLDAARRPIRARNHDQHDPALESADKE